MILETKWRMYLLIALICSAAMAMNGYEYGTHDATLYVPMIERGADPSLFPGDYLFKESSHGYSLWFPAMAALVRIFPSEPVFFGGYILSIFLLFLAVYHLSLNLFASRPAALLALLLIANYRWVGGSTMSTFEVVYTVRTPAIPMAIAFLIPYCKKRFVFAAILAGLSFVIHPITALPCVCLLAYKSSTALWKRKPQQFLKITGPFLIIVSPLLVRVFLFNQNSFSSLSAFQIQDPLWNHIINLRTSYVFLANWKPWILAWGNIILYLEVLVVVLVVRRAVPAYKQADATACEVIGICLCLLGVTGVFADLFPIPLVVQFQAGRGLYLVVYLFVIYAAWVLWTGYAQMQDVYVSNISLGTSRNFSVQMIFVNLFGLSIITLMMTEVPVSLFQCVCLLAWTLLTNNRTRPSVQRILFPGMGLVSVILVFGVNSVCRTTYGTAMFAACMVFIAVSLVLYPNRLKSFGATAITQSVVFVSLSAMALAAIMTLVSHYSEGGLEEHLQIPRLYHGDEWVDAQRWARNNTPQEAMFLVPWMKCGFRVYSQRSVAGEWKDGGPAMFSFLHAKRWLLRKKDLFGYDAFDEKQILALGKKYGADFAVVSRPNVLDLPQVYANGQYRIYAVKSVLR